MEHKELTHTGIYMSPGRFATRLVKPSWPYYALAFCKPHRMLLNYVDPLQLVEHNCAFDRLILERESS
jgi:hypothetical protein